jgi:hypothetical protein
MSENALPDIVAMTQRIQELEEQTTQLQQQLQQQNTAEESPVAANLVVNKAPFRVEIPCASGDDLAESREFVRIASKLPLLLPNTDGGYLKQYLSVRLRGSASYWADEWLTNPANQNATTQQFVNAYREMFVDSSNVQQIILRQLHTAKQRTTVEQLYRYMCEKILMLKELPRDMEVIRVYTDALADRAVALAVLQSHPKTLEEAHNCALATSSLLRTSRTPARSNDRPHQSTKPFQKPHQHQQRRTQFPSRHIGYALAAMDSETPQQERLAKLTDEEREHCFANSLCLRCRQPGHHSKNCPKTKHDKPMGFGRGGPRRH